jgi:hypothetical protein
MASPEESIGLSGRGFEIRRLSWQDDPLAEIALPGAPLRVTRGLGSGLARSASDPPGFFWAVGDRGPNLKIKAAIRRYGLDALKPLAGRDGAKVMPCLDHGPAISHLRLDGDTVSLVRSLALRGSDGRHLSGLPPPASPHAEGEPIYSIAGEPLGTDPSGVDSEGIAALAGGGFWIGDEYGPSLLRVDADGTVIARWVPAGTEEWFEGAAYPIVPALPAIASARRLNRGFEALALSPDERSLYVIFQSPLAFPDRAAHERSRHVRVWRLDASSGALEAEYLYPLDPPSSFERDRALGKVAGTDIKVSEAIMLGADRLLVLERASASTKFYAVELLPHYLVPPEYSDPATRPTLEQLDDEGLKAAEIPVVAKTLVLDTDLAPEICGDLEGAIFLSPRQLLLVNDNDFGVDGVETQFWLVTFDQPIESGS